ncbi:MAG: DUF2007 domain-containing protein [Terriglobales bacterium]|jgi:hypothetical protein
MTTPEQERVRLAAVYSAMSDNELLKIAHSGDELTAVAQELFAAEIGRRGLNTTSVPVDDLSEAETAETPAPPSEQECARFARLYSVLSEGELEELAVRGFELSDAAHQALESEIARRGLNVAIAMPPGVDVYELNETVTVRKFRDLPEALLAKGSLQSAGIEAYLLDDNMIRMDWFISNLLGGIKLQVRPEDVEAANEILDQPTPEVLEVEGVGDYEQPKCPRCQSFDVAYQELDKFASYGTAYVGIPIPIHKSTWTCHACGHEWTAPDGEPSGDAAAI